MILHDLLESRMGDLAIEYQDYKELAPLAFLNRYKITKDEWASKYWQLIKNRETVHEDAEGLNIGDEVIITGNVQYKGKTGVIKDFGKDNRFVVVDLYNHGTHSFHSSDVSQNDYEDSEDENGDDEGFYVAIGSEDDGGFVGMIVKDGGKWREVKVAGNAPHNWGTGYMGYLSPQDVMQWISKDYGRYAEVEGPFDDEESAREYAQMQYGLDEGVTEDYNAEYDDEAGMADNNLETLERAVEGIDELIDAGDNLPEWCQEKIAVAKSMLVTVWDYMKSEEDRGAVDESLADEFMAMAKAKGMNPRLRGTPDEERARTDAMLKQRAADRAAAPKPQGPDAEERAKLEAALKQLEARFDPDFEYSDDYSFWSRQNQIKKQIDSIKQRLAQGVAEGYHLDEGAMETISTLVKKLPGIGKYYQIAQEYKPQLVQILKTSKSGKEVKQKMEALLAQTSTPVAEAGWTKQLGGLALGGGSILSTMWMNAMGMIDGVLAHAAAGEVGGAVASGSILGLIPVTLMLFAAMLLFKGSKQSSDEKAQQFQAQRGQQGVAEGDVVSLDQRRPTTMTAEFVNWLRANYPAMTVKDLKDPQKRNSAYREFIASQRQDQLDEKQDACYNKVKSRYKVWPSAYASGALVQCRKKGADNWGTGDKKK